MVKSLQKNSSLFLLIIPFLLLFLVYFYTSTPQFLSQSDTISSYLILDLLLTIPLIYFLVVRKTKVPNTTVVPVLFLGLILGYSVLPSDQHYYLDLFKQFGVPVIEISVLVFVILKVRKAVKSFQKNNLPGSDFYNVLQATCREIIPGRLSGFLVSEISVIYYGFLNWTKPDLASSDFTYHKRSGSPALFGALIFIILVETISVHIILLQWSHLAALILTILSVYSGLQFLGFARSLSKRPISIEDDVLYLKYGILNESIIPISEIESVELSRKRLEFDDEVRKFSILGELESHNVILRCTSTQTMNGIYGLKKTFSTLALHVDEKERFKEYIDAVKQRLNTD